MMNNSSFARFARAFFIFGHFAVVLVLCTTWKDLFCGCMDNVSMWWQMFNFVCWSLKRLFQSNSRKVRTHFTSIMALNNCELWSYVRGGQKTRLIFVSESSNKKWRHIRLKLSWTLVSLETKDGGSTRNIFFYILNWQLPKLYTMTV